MFNSESDRKSPNLPGMLACLTLLFISAQLSFFIIHNKVTELMDSLVNVSIVLQLLHPVILLPLAGYILLQLMAYALFTGWIWFISATTGRMFRFSKAGVYWLGILLWALACIDILALNQYFFPDSFFSKLLSNSIEFGQHSGMLAVVTSIPLMAATVTGLLFCFWTGYCRKTGSVIMLVLTLVGASGLYNIWLSHGGISASRKSQHGKPDIIIIGLDSLRPDFTGYFGSQTAHTPNIDAFLREARVFNQAYTPLARTYPSWISVLTAKYPKHNFARNNLVNPGRVITNETLPRRLRRAGYETVYATDEKRFSNITEAYGFDRVLGPRMGVNDFLLGSLTDFPLGNLLVNLPGANWLLPYNYGNRAAAVTYNPESFLRLVRLGLVSRTDKPLFLSIHFCLSHWPFTWAGDGMRSSAKMPDLYRNSVQGVDRQLGELMEILKANGLLENSLVVLLSDHGTALGLPGDRIIASANYRGEPEKLRLIPSLRLSSASANTTNFRRDYTISTAYGQGTNVLSLTQYRVLLAFRRYGAEQSAARISRMSALLDVAPTILDFLKLPPLDQADGISQLDQLTGPAQADSGDRMLFLETGDSMTEIETDHIYVEKVIKHQIGIYTIDPVSGLLMMSVPAEQSIIRNKQLAILWNGWMLAHYPARIEIKLVKKKVKQELRLVRRRTILPPYYVLVNLETGRWTVGLSTPLAKEAPTLDLHRRLTAFYGNELPPSGVLPNTGHGEAG